MISVRFLANPVYIDYLANISINIHEKSLAMDMDVKFHMHGNSARKVATCDVCASV